MTKEETRKIIEGMALPEAQRQAAKRTLTRATSSEDIEVAQDSSGNVTIRRSRPGRVGKQVLEDLIDADGKKVVVQKAYDAEGNLVHLDPKGGSA